MSATYTPVVALRCIACSGRSWVPGRVPADLDGFRWKCPHHGESGSGFVETGVGDAGRDYEVVGFSVVDLPVSELDAVVDPAAYEVDEVRFDDYEAVEVVGLTPNEQAEARGVTGGTVRSNVADAREVLL